MVENLKVINLMDKNFKFVSRTKEKFIYKYEDKELEQLSILELLFSEEEQKIKKIDIYKFIVDEPVENIHITRGIDNIIEVDYYQNDYEYVTIDKSKDLYNVSVHLLYSNLDNDSYLESNRLDLIKKGHKKHKSLYKIPVEDNYYITTDKHIRYVSANCVSKLKRLTEFLVPSINKIEYELFNKKELNELDFEVVEENDLDTQKFIESKLNIPIETYVYDRNYKLLGEKGKAIIYQNTQDDIKELEIYLNDTKDKIQEIRLVDYCESYIEGIKTKSKIRIIRFMQIEDKINITLCNRKKESMIMNSHTLDKNNISAKAIINKEGKIDSLEVKIQNQLGTFNLTKSPNRNMEFYDKNNASYYFLSNSFEQFRMFLGYAPIILDKLEDELINDEKSTSLIKKL